MPRFRLAPSNTSSATGRRSRFPMRAFPSPSQALSQRRSVQAISSTCRRTKSMRAQAKLAVLIGLVGFGSGCMNDAYRRADGLTEGAGDKLAGNTVMQMVDPWQYGGEDTDIARPVRR